MDFNGFYEVCPVPSENAERPLLAICKGHNSTVRTLKLQATTAQVHKKESAGAESHRGGLPK